MKTRIHVQALLAAAFLLISAAGCLLLSRPAAALTVSKIRDQYYKSYNYEKLQDYKNAVKAMIPVFEKYPKGYTVNLRLGWLYYLKRNYANSINHYKIAGDAAPYSIEVKLGYSLPLMIQNKYDQAETVLYQILSVDQNNYYANLKLVKICRLRKKFDLAEKVARGMLLLYPLDVAFLTELALTLRDNEKKKEAVALFMDILILDPENTAAKSYLEK